MNDLTNDNIFKSIVRSTRNSVYLLDKDCRYLYLNPSHIQRLGLLPDNYVGTPYSAVHDKENTRIMESRIREVLADGKEIIDEYSKGGRWFARHFSPFRESESGEILAITVISTEITPMKKAEEALLLSNKKLMLLSEITRHDILNMLMALSGSLEMMKRKNTNQSLEKYIDISSKAVDKINEQIKFTRDYQEIGMKEPKWHDLRNSILKSTDTINPAGIPIETDIWDVKVLADPLLDKVFHNLTENALKYGKKLTWIRFSAAEVNGELVIICEDNGKGIPDGQKENIFTRKYFTHTGFGLHLSREILAITGITIRETGVVGNGARFEIIVPAGAYQIGAGG
jgi:PAS domain S-box-containing protein